MKRFLLALTLVFSPLAAVAEDNINLYLGGLSYHFSDRSGNNGDYNEVHNNIGLEWEHKLGNRTLGKNFYVGLGAQYLENSVEEDSILLTVNAKKKWYIDRDWQFAAGVMVGAQNGYPKVSENRDEDEFVPVAYPIVELNYQRVGAWATCVPKVYNSGFCFLGFKVHMFEL